MATDRDNLTGDGGWGFDTRAVRAGFERTEYGEHSEPMFLTSSFVHKSAKHAADKFANEAPGFIYSRFGNPTIQTFQDRLAALEGADACLATASGMSAIMSVLISLTRAGDHAVSSQGVFGTTIQLFGLFAKYGVDTSYVPLSDPEQWRAAIRPNTRFFYLETPSNPLTEVADVAGDRRHCASARHHAGGGQLFLHAGAAAPVGVGCRYRRSLGDQISGRAGADSGRRCVGFDSIHYRKTSAGRSLYRARLCRPLTPGC